MGSVSVSAFPTVVTARGQPGRLARCAATAVSAGGISTGSANSVAGGRGRSIADGDQDRRPADNDRWAVPAVAALLILQLDRDFDIALDAVE
nr:hypothetical protein L204_01233 [Cryptococcus depauperatus CBS 7855]